MELEFPRQIFEKMPILNVMKIHPVGVWVVPCVRTGRS